MDSTQIDMLGSFEQFIDQYSLPIHSTIAILTGMANPAELERITINALTHLWRNNDLLFSERRPTAFIYKVVLQHVFTYLKDHSNTGRIELLENTLLIDPIHYKYILKS